MGLWGDNNSVLFFFGASVVGLADARLPGLLLLLSSDGIKDAIRIGGLCCVLFNITFSSTTRREWFKRCRFHTMRTRNCAAVAVRLRSVVLRSSTFSFVLCQCRFDVDRLLCLLFRCPRFSTICTIFSLRMTSVLKSGDLIFFPIIFSTKSLKLDHQIFL